MSKQQGLGNTGLSYTGMNNTGLSYTDLNNTGLNNTCLNNTGLNNITMQKKLNIFVFEKQYWPEKNTFMEKNTRSKT